MTNGHGFMKVKEWFFDQTNDAARNYGIILSGEYKYGMLDHSIFRVEELLIETDKAIKARLEAETSRGNLSSWICWIPKSVIIEGYEKNGADV